MHHSTSAAAVISSAATVYILLYYDLQAAIWQQHDQYRHAFSKMTWRNVSANLVVSVYWNLICNIVVCGDIHRCNIACCLCTKITFVFQYTLFSLCCSTS
eukprot:14280-Heterococcus_DN1.PRE.1